MKITDQLLKDLRFDEGLRLEVYKDHLGEPTIGVGTLLPVYDKECEAIIEYCKANKPRYHHGMFEQYRNGYTFKKPIDDEIAKILLNSRLIAIAEEVSNGLKKEYPNIDQENEAISEVLLNMAYQLGKPRLFTFKKMLTALNNKDYKEVVVQMKDSRWYIQTTNRANRLIDRVEKYANN